MNGITPLLRITRNTVALVTLIAGSLTHLVQAGQVAPELRQLEQQVMQTVAAVKDSVIAIELVGPDQQTIGSGSGVIVDPSGLIFTAAHVVDGHQFARAILADGSKHEITILGMNRYKDAAVCMFSDTTLSWPYSPLGNSDETDVTDWVIAIGHSRGYDETRTAPVRFGRVRAHNPGRYLTTDCPLIGGDPGGPLFNIQGEVIAINSSINGLARFNVHAGISGFIDDLDRMKRKSWGTLQPNVLYTPETPAIGINFPSSNSRYQRNDPRPIIVSIIPNGPADLAGLLPGDLIVKVDADPVTTQLDVMIALGRKQPQDQVTVIIKRDGELMRAEVTLAARKSMGSERDMLAPRLEHTDDSPYLREVDKPRLQQQMVDLFSWATPLRETRGDTFVQLFAP